MRGLLKWLGFNKTTAESANLPTVSDLSNLRGKRILIRSSLNVPLENGQVAEMFRIDQSLTTIKYLQNAGAKVIVIAHIGRKPEETLLPVYEVLKTKVGAKWGGRLSGETKAMVQTLQDGEVLLLENLRQDERESGNDDSLARELADLAEIFVSDAFSDSHREHASIVGVPRYLPSYFGFSFAEEYRMLKSALEPISPSVFVIGGAKFETKMPLILKFASKYDQVFVGGALANDIFKARGLEVGRSLVSDVDLRGSEVMSCKNLIWPIDVVVEGAEGKKTVMADEVKPDEFIYDNGPKSIQNLAPLIEKASTVLWNGPLGNYEKGYVEGTVELAKVIARSNAHSVVGGGDTVAAISSLGLTDQFDFVSTAGGAMLVFLETGTLPAIEAVLRR